MMAAYCFFVKQSLKNQIGFLIHPVRQTQECHGSTDNNGLVFIITLDDFAQHLGACLSVSVELFVAAR